MRLPMSPVAVGNQVPCSAGSCGTTFLPRTDGSLYFCAGPAKVGMAWLWARLPRPRRKAFRHGRGPKIPPASISDAGDQSRGKQIPLTRTKLLKTAIDIARPNRRGRGGEGALGVVGFSPCGRDRSGRVKCFRIRFGRFPRCLVHVTLHNNLTLANRLCTPRTS